jgi:hypothetical protein
MSDLNMTAVVLGFALVIALFTKLHRRMSVPAWLSPLKLDGLVGVLEMIMPWIQKGKALAFVVGYLVMVLLLLNASLLVVLLLLNQLSHWLFTPSSNRFITQVA